MRKKIILFILVIFWMSLIFLFSNQKAYQSSSMSNGIVDKIIDFIEWIIGHNIDNEKLYDILVLIIRKGAHFFVYLILGILVYNLVKLYKLNSKEIIIISILVCLIYAFSDEIHQLFVSGRSGELKDVLIDLSGSLLGIYLVIFINNIKVKKISKKIC